MKLSRFNSLLVVSALIAALIGFPVASVLANIFSGGTSPTWLHLASTVLSEYVGNTLVLCLGVGFGVVIVGVATAWLTAMHDFPGRRIFEWALVLPLAIPAYVLAYVQQVIGHRFADIAPCNTIARVSCPVLLVHGSEDETGPVAEAEQSHAGRASDAVELLLVPGSHDDYGDIGRQFAAVRDFLDRAFVARCFRI